MQCSRHDCRAAATNRIGFEFWCEAHPEDRANGLTNLAACQAHSDNDELGADLLTDAFKARIRAEFKRAGRMPPDSFAVVLLPLT